MASVLFFIAEHCFAHHFVKIRLPRIFWTEVDQIYSRCRSGSHMARRTKVLFGLAIEKSNIKANLMEIWLPGSETDFVRTQIRNRGNDLSDADRILGRHVQHII